MSRSISPCNSELSLSPLRRASTLRASSLEPPSDETNDPAAEQVHDMTESTGYAPVASKPDAEDLSVAKPPPSTLRVWCLEVLSIFLAFSSLVSIILILSIHQGRPLPQWPSFVSVNSLVAVFSAMLKAALVMPVAEGIGQLKWSWFYSQPQKIRDISLFDQASRGPWGSILLVAGQLGRPTKAYLATLGAIVIIGALAVDPFSQALLDHQLCHTLSAKNASVPRTNEYTGTAYFEGWWGDAAPARRMTTSVYEGLVLPYDRPSPSINVQCPSGECDFGWNQSEPYFSSLAMCHSCEDATAEIIEMNVDKPFTARETTYYLEARGDSSFRNISISARTPLASSSYTDSHDSVVDMMMLTTNKTCNLDSFDSNCTLMSLDDISSMAPIAARCSLRPCVKEYQARVLNHAYFEKEIGNEPVYLDQANLSIHWDRSRQIRFSTLTNYSYVEGRRIDCSPKTEPGPGIMPFRPESNIPWHLPSPKIGMDNNAPEWDDGATTVEEASKFYPRECVWLIENFASSGLENLIEDLMTAELTSVSQGGAMLLLDKVQGSQWLQNVHNQGRGNLSTVEAMVRGLANGITAAMRNYPQEGEELSDAVREEPYDYETEEEAKIRRTMRLERDKLGSYRGLAYQVDTCIIVHWAWIAYPGFLLLLQVVFCAAMLLTKPTSGAAARDAGEFSDWKSSPLVLVSLGWGESLHRKLRPLYSVKDTDDLVEKTKVMLQRGDPDDPRAARWQLVDC